MVQGKLQCARCTAVEGRPVWCWIDRTNGSEHIRLAEEVIKLWAREMVRVKSMVVVLCLTIIQHENKCDRECKVPPNCLSLDKLREAADRDTRARNRRKNNGATVPDIHVHLGSPLRDMSTNGHRRHHHSHRSHRSKHHRHHHRHKRSSYSSEGSSSSESDSDVLETRIPIADILQSLDKVELDAWYPSYKDTLVARGILNARSVLDWPAAWYEKEVGMAPGLVKPFLRHVEAMLRKRRRSSSGHGHEKRVRVNNENEPVAVVA